MRSIDWNAVMSGLAPEEFFARTWQREPLLRRRQRPDPLADVVSSRRMEELLRTGALRWPAVRVVRHPDAPSPESYVDGTAKPPVEGTLDPVATARMMGEGASIIVDALESISPRAHELCRAVSAVFGGTTTSSAYLSPPRARALPPHWDTDDVFVLQLEGRKLWRLATPTFELPLAHQGSGDIEEPKDARDVWLEPGDTLYLPRGTIHSVRTGDTPSLHVSLGTYTHRWIAVFRALLDELEADLAFRRGLPPDVVRRARAGSLEMQGFAELAGVLAERLRVPGTLDRLLGALPRSREPFAEGELLDAVNARAIASDTVVVLRAEIDARWEIRGGEVVVAWRDRVLHVPEAAADAVGRLFAGAPVRVEDLPGLDAEGQMTMAAVFLSEGLLRRGDRAS